MDNLFEVIVPIIFAAIYFFGNMLSKKSDDDGLPSGRSSGEDADAIERQRRIQEEIRRKIMERRRAAEDGAPMGAPSSSAASSRREQADSARDRSFPERHRKGQPELSHPSRHPVGHRRKMREQQKETLDRRHSSHPAPVDDAYGNQIQAKLEQIEATKIQAERLRKQAAQSASSLRPAQSTPGSQADMSGRRRPALGSVRATLRNPATARAAFIYGEVLGPAISQRKKQTVPGLS